MSFFEHIKQSREPVKKIGFQWVTMLVKYDLDGNAEVVKTFSKPAKESSIKAGKKSKKKEEPKKPTVNFADVNSIEEEDLFG